MHPFGAFHTVTATYDGTTLRSYVDGVLQAEGAVHLTPQLPGHTSLGVRINHVFFFKGTIYEARFTRHVLPTQKFLAPHKESTSMPRLCDGLILDKVGSTFYPTVQYVW